MLKRLLQTAARFRRAREATAAVEFALVVPMMLTMYLGSIELSQAFTVDERVITVAGTIGDLVARSNKTITKTTLTDYFKAATAILSPYPTTSLQQVVSVVSVAKTSGVATVEWSQSYNGGTAKIAGTVYAGSHPIPTSMINISKGSWIIVSESSYSYTPILGIFFKNPFQFYHQSFYAPRFASDITYDSAH